MILVRPVTSIGKVVLGACVALVLAMPLYVCLPAYAEDSGASSVDAIDGAFDTAEELPGVSDEDLEKVIFLSAQAHMAGVGWIDPVI